MESYFQRNIIWQDPLKPISLSEKTVHIWYGNLQHYHLGFDFVEFLSPQEKSRAGRYKFDLDRERFILRRAILRMILGKYFTEDLSNIVIKTSDLGKPEISVNSRASHILCSFSYSQESVIYSISKNLRLGIDIEHTAKIDTDSILNILFAFGIPDKEWFQQKPKDIHFYGLWTSLEAYLKAVGTGFSQALDDEFWARFPVDRASGELRNPHWSVVQFAPEKGLFSTLVVDAPEVEAKFFNFSYAMKLNKDNHISFRGD